MPFGGEGFLAAAAHMAVGDARELMDSLAAVDWQ
jgi:hypothetical protein